MSRAVRETRIAHGSRGDEAELFTRHHAALLRAVRGAVRAPDALVEDACASAWAILLRRQPERSETLFGWLRTVAIHEAYRLSGQQHATSSLDALAGPQGESWDALIPDRRTLDDAVEARRALGVLAALPRHERETLALRVAGFRYAAIQRLRGQVTYTNVNKQLVRARQRIRGREASE
jgi:DNA-directed RNA polymerase specialized sigma24 family protein